MKCFVFVSTQLMRSTTWLYHISLLKTSNHKKVHVKIKRSYEVGNLVLRLKEETASWELTENALTRSEKFSLLEHINLKILMERLCLTPETFNT